MDSEGRSRRLRRVAARVVGAHRAPAPPPSVPDETEPTTDEALLTGSGLFDHDWYAATAGCAPDRAAAVRHYLAHGARRGLHPHPLFDPAYFVDVLGEEMLAQLGEDDPFVFYLRRRLFRRRTHPLFDTQQYLRDTPDAIAHPLGPIGHYSEVGAPEGLRPNAWLPEGDDGRCADLRVWIEQRQAEWRERRRSLPRGWRPEHNRRREERYLLNHPADDADVAEGVTVSVVVNAGLSEEQLRTSLLALAAQSRPVHDVVVVDRGGIDDLDALLTTTLPGISVTTVEVGYDGVAQGIDEAWRRTSGSHVAFLDAADVWRPERLRLLASAIGDEAMAADVIEGRSKDGRVTYAADVHPDGRVRYRGAVDLSRLLLRRDALVEVDGFDASLPGAFAFDLVLRLAERHQLVEVPVLGSSRAFRDRLAAHRPPTSRRHPADHVNLQSWADVALNRHLIPWSQLAGVSREPDLVSVVIPTYDDWRLTVAAVTSVVESDGVGGLGVQVLVVDNGSSAVVSTMLDALAAEHPQVSVLHSPVNHGFALGSNLALAHATGATTVFLNNDTTVPPDWLVPIKESLDDDDVLGVQSLLVYPSGAIQSAGVAFPSTGGLPHAFLQGFPVEDAAGVGNQRFHALTGAALALRTDDAIALQGFDPLFTNGMEDVDLCQRLEAARPGRFVVRPEAPVVHYESRTPGRYTRSMQNRLLYLDRWAGVAEPRDDVALWASAGYRVLDHQIGRHADRHQRRLLLPEPVLVRSRRLQVAESPPRLRWAIKNPAPAGAEAELWGDTHFARALASALREVGQEVVIDHRPEFERATSRHDDVALVLRGLAPFGPSPEQVSIAWVISHPEMLARAEAMSYDRVLAASVAWSAAASERWGIPVEPLLQATDPSLFHPDRGVPDTGHPVLFVGSSRKVHRPIVRDAVEAGLPLSVYGALWSGFVPRKMVKAKYLDNLELGAYYRRAGIVLNDHWEDMRVQGFVSNRLFDAVASGARVVSDHVDGMEELFGRSVQTYSSLEELIELTSMYEPDEVFGSDEERRAVAARVAREHSFRARAERLVAVAVEARKQRGFTD